MRNFRRFLLLPVFLFVVLGCQIFPNGAESTQTSGTTTVSDQPAAYPYPFPYPPADITQEAYPVTSPEAQVASPEMGMVYPELNDGDTIDWFKAMGAVVSGQVEKVVQTHDLNVYLTLKDGRTLNTVEPAIDDIIKLIQMCGDVCKDIMIATE